MPNLDELALSDLWREVRSQDPGIELAALIGAARVMAQTLIPKVDVAISGMKYAQTDQQTIFGTADGLDEFPLPGKRVDKFLGDVIHEAGHCLFSPDKTTLVALMMRELGVYFREGKFLADLVNILEDLYVDHRLSAFPVYREYLMRSVADTLSGMDLDTNCPTLKTDTPIRMDILNAFIFIGLSAKLPVLSPKSASALVGLMDISQKLNIGKISRETAIRDSWRILRELPVEPPPPPPPVPPPPSPASSPEPVLETPEPSESPDSGDDSGDAKESGEEPEKEEKESGESSDEPSEDTKADETAADDSGEDEPAENKDDKPDEAEAVESEKDDDTKPETEPEPEPEPAPIPATPSPKSIDLAKELNKDISSKQPLSQETAADVVNAITEQRQDLTQMVSALAGNSTYQTILFTPTDSADIVGTRRRTAEAEEELRRVFQQFRDKRTAYYRGLYSGKVSNRRLHRVGYGEERVFQRKERPEEIDLALCLLMDCSGSMRQYMDLIFEIVTAITDSLSKEKVDFMALGYSSSFGKVSLARFYDRESGLHLGRQRLGGDTPSYEGLAAAIAQLLKWGQNKKRLLIHYTDGSPNSAGTSFIKELLDKARADGIVDYHVIPPGPTPRPDLYGERILVLEELRKLPEVVEVILRKTMEVQ